MWIRDNFKSVLFIVYDGTINLLFAVNDKVLPVIIFLDYKKTSGYISAVHLSFLLVTRAFS